MGRLGALNSLAFGRSPFQAPELDDDGDFIIGPYARDVDDKDHYVQQFSGRGQPKNDSSEFSRRAMQHAQNSVLETVGAVVRREEAAKSAWQRKSKADKIEGIIRENRRGTMVLGAAPLLVLSSTWATTALRRRVQTFRSYLSPPLLHIIRSEVNTLGLRSFLTDGLLPEIVYHLIRRLLHGLQTLEITFEISISGTKFSWTPWSPRLAGIVLPLVLFPIKVFSVLQSLHLITPLSHLGIRSFIPFTQSSPVLLPIVPEEWSVASAMLFLTKLCCQPVVILIIQENIKTTIHRSIGRIISLSLTPRPDRPDKLTIDAASQDRQTLDFLTSVGHNPRSRAERSRKSGGIGFLAAVRAEFEFVTESLQYLRNLSLRQISPSLVRQRNAEPQPLNSDVASRLRSRSEALQREMVHNDLETLRNDDSRRENVQRQAHRRALAEFGIENDAEMSDYLLPPWEIIDSPSTTVPGPINLSMEEAAGLGDEEETRPPFPFTANNTFDAEEREGEGRILASMSHDDALPTGIGSINANTGRRLLSRWMPNNAAIFETPIQSPGDPPELLRNPFESASDPSRDSVLEEVTRLAPEDVNIREIPNGRLTVDFEIRTGELGSGAAPDLDESTAAVHPDLLPAAPDSPLERNATPPAIALNRESNRAQDDDRSPTPESLSTPSSWSNISWRLREGPFTSRRRGLALNGDTNPVNATANSYGWLDSDDGGAKNTQPETRHRVTTLSLLPAGIFVDQFAGLIATAVTLPLDALFVRGLVHGFLSNPAELPGASVAALGLRSDVYGLSEWFGGSSSGGVQTRLKYAGLVALVMGVQGCITSISWAVVARFAIALGRRSGWGQL